VKYGFMWHRWFGHEDGNVKCLQTTTDTKR